MRRAALLVAAALVVAGCYSGEQKPGPNDGSNLDFGITQTITLDDAGIHPNVINGRVGQAVSVTNHGTKDHTLSSDSLDTGTVRPGETTTVYFSETATIGAHDRTDPTHTATIKIEPRASSSS
ncbi:MAG TPA: hypothetical protein VFV00_08660 [Acidimicrobiales bacterium]|nr:hypothetical protein [Acidimicrobiales bacterium]